MEGINKFISESLEYRRSNDSLRTLKPENNLIDFCSNDYLGFAHSMEFRAMFETEMKKYPHYRMGSGGSRLLAGNDRFTENLENEIAKFHKAESSLLFNSGYNANIGLFSCIPQRGDTIISDEYIHASIIDGIRLSHASRFVFRHNDLQNLEQKLKLAKGRIFIVVESIYSMDGDEAPLTEIAKIAKKHDAALIVDEAHAIGIFGNSGRGLVHELGLCDKVFARIITFGKGMGAHGAAVLGSDQLRNYLINFSRSFIFTTASSFLSHLAIKVSYDLLKIRDHQTMIHERIRQFKQNINPVINLLQSRSAIQIILVPGNSQAREAAIKIQQAGFDVRAILSPTVAIGTERLRICLHNHNSMNEINNLCTILNQIL
ncbi:8-amino-7-oxononanoate synthase [Daejeonella rubra]|uniref:8-amino-7-oxononanoate synthase n=1 Tax=Daejeonella rubra TaxID=990371 RepID=A0A1G9M657_9SPHI|nr:8-amino-7-oxononanoate synthase [Daejeonella rubra]SDL69624.1 8-amino-7-oxononanoate synthase [Daejeonella rubra]